MHNFVIDYIFKPTRYVASRSARVILHVISAIFALPDTSRGHNNCQNEDYLDSESHPTVTGENDLITGSLNYKTGLFDDGTDPYGKYAKDLYDD